MRIEIREAKKIVIRRVDSVSKEPLVIEKDKAEEVLERFIYFRANGVYELEVDGKVLGQVKSSEKGTFYEPSRLIKEKRIEVRENRREKRWDYFVKPEGKKNRIHLLTLEQDRFF